MTKIDNSSTEAQNFINQIFNTNPTNKNAVFVKNKKTNGVYLCLYNVVSSENEVQTYYHDPTVKFNKTDLVIDFKESEVTSEQKNRKNSIENYSVYEITSPKNIEKIIIYKNGEEIPIDMVFLGD